MNIAIREYQEKDKQTLISLSETLHNYVMELDPIKRIRIMPGFGENTVSSIVKSFTDNEGKCFLAEADGKVIGYIAGLIAKQSEENLLSVVPTRLGVIDDLFVVESFRNHHVGEMLLQKMEGYFKESGCDSIWLEVFSPNEKAHEFYKRHGFIDREVNMLKKI